MARKSLGIVLGSRGLQVAEISAGSRGCRMGPAADFPLGEGDSLQDPAALGRKLAQFLKDGGFSASQVTFGLPAQWLMLKEVTLPPAAPGTLNSMLLIQAERDFSLEPANLVLDYVPGPSGAEGQSVMLVAALRERVEQLRPLAAAAGLKIQAVTATTLALAAASPSGDVLYCGLNGVELAARGSNGLPQLRHIAPGSMFGKHDGQPAARALAGELRRALAMHPRGADANGLTVWDDAGLEPSFIRELAAETGTSVELGERFGPVAVEGLQPGAAGAAALALCLFHPRLLPLDLLHSRLAVKPPSKLGARIAVGALAALLLLGAAAYLVLKWQENAAQVAQLRKQRDEMKESVEGAKAFSAKVQATRTWYEGRPNYLECLRTITQCFPKEGRIWTTSLSLREDLRGSLTGRAVDERAMLDLLRELKSAKTSLSQVKLLYMRGTPTKNSEVTFEVTFAFRVAESP